MRKVILLIVVIMFSVQVAYPAGKVIHVGEGQKFESIQAAIVAASKGDTVRILPGIYNEQITIDKDIVVQGGGVTNTYISVLDISEGAAIYLHSGKLMWIAVTSSASGIEMKNSTLANCLIHNCAIHGVYTYGKDAVVNNCISINNGDDGFHSPHGGNYSIIVVNSIAAWNKDYGFYWRDYYGGNGTYRNCTSFGNRSNYMNGSMSDCLTADPSLSSDGLYRISETSPCKDTGDPTLLDHDKSRSDMGIYGGPDAPLMPYVSLPANIKLNDDGTIQFDLDGKIGY